MIDAVLRVTGESEVLAAWPTIAATAGRRNSYVDVLSLRRPPADGALLVGGRRSSAPT